MNGFTQNHSIKPYSQTTISIFFESDPKTENLSVEHKSPNTGGRRCSGFSELTTERPPNTQFHSTKCLMQSTVLGPKKNKRVNKSELCLAQESYRLNGRVSAPV